jgi:hypothetical protein
MWREDGLGEVYAYLPEGKQDSSFCDDEDKVICNPDYGYSLGRGKFGFKLASWNTVSQTLKLNTPGKSDGSLSLKVNGKSVISMDNIVFRTAKGDTIGGICKCPTKTKNHLNHFSNFFFSFRLQCSILSLADLTLHGQLLRTSTLTLRDSVPP